MIMQPPLSSPKNYHKPPRFSQKNLWKKSLPHKTLGFFLRKIYEKIAIENI